MNSHCSTLTGARRCGARNQFDLNNARWAAAFLVLACCLFLWGLNAAAQSPAGRVVAWGLIELPNLRPGEVLLTNISCGGTFNAATTRAGTVVTWGSGDASKQPANLSNIVAIATSKNSLGIVALRDTGTLVSWSRGGNTVFSTNPPGITGVRAISLGLDYGLALRSNGTVAAWGNPPSGGTNVPAGLMSVAAIAAGGDHGLALTSNGTVVAWGGYLAETTNVPPGLDNVVQIAAHWNTSVALRKNGTVVSWGYSMPEAPAGLGDVASIACDDGTAIAVRSNGTVVVWGRPDSYNFQALSNLPPVLTDIVEVSAGGGHAFARRQDGTFVGWGINALFTATLPPALTDVTALGTGWRGYAFTHVDDGGRLVNDSTWNTERISQASNAVAVANGGGDSAYENTLALLRDGSVFVSTDDPSGAMDAPAGLTDVVAVSAGHRHSVVLRANGEVISWGGCCSGYGETNVPAGLSDVKAISAGYEFTMALRSNGTVVTWGSVPLGQPLLTNIVAVSGGYGHALALRSDGKVIAWGWNPYGQTNVPSNLSNVVAISAGWFHSVALKSDGKVVVWGDNFPGTRTPPAGLRNVVAISADVYSTYALVLDPKFSAIRRDGSNVVLGFRSFLGQAYQIQYSTDLAPNSWFNLPGGHVTGTGANLEVLDTNVIPAQPARFYRLVEVN